jgi:hypothetical protein
VESGVMTDGKVTITSSSRENVSEIIKQSFGENAEAIFNSMDSQRNRKKDGNQLDPKE